jgi:hypothetical protein
MNAFYLQSADQIFPVYGVSSIAEAKKYAGEFDKVIETDEKVYMNMATGSVDFASGWDDIAKVVEVRYCSETEGWVCNE